ncbi:hypothetical protein HYS31_08110 [Candidatus Woesearchaeota archaeon]|nr:hypothetical protein [Candidatus Woesearchaeota archaeon]
MDIGKDFSDSYYGLMRNKFVILPAFIASVVFTIVLLAVLWSSGIFQDFSAYNSLREQYIEQIGAESDTQVDEVKFNSYLESNGFAWNNIRQFINWRTGIFIVLLVAVLAVFSFYMRCISLSIITLIVKKQKISTTLLLRFVGRFFFRLAWLHLLLALIIIVPLTVGLLGVVLSFFINKILGIISLMLVILLLIAYGIFVFIRLVFALPIAFLDDKTAYRSVREGYAATKGRFLDALLVFAIFVGIAIGFSFLSNMLLNFFPLVMLLDKPAIIAIVLFMLLVYYFLNSIIDAFTHLFLFHAYADFKRSAGAVRKANKPKSFKS